MLRADARSELLSLQLTCCPFSFLETLHGTALIRNTSVSALLNCDELICINRS